MAQTATVNNQEVQLRQWCVSMSPKGNETIEEQLQHAQKLFEWITTNSGITVVDGSGSPIK